MRMNKSLSESILSSKDERASDDEVLTPLLPEINLIVDPKIKSFVKALLLRATPFWSSVSSTMNPESHPPDENKPGGIVLHTKRVVRVVQLLMQSYDYSSSDRDNLIAAAILHDITKAIWGDVEKEVILHDALHPYTVDSFVEWCVNEDHINADSSKYHTLDVSIDIIQAILRLIRCSHGVWSPIPETIPVSSSEKILHTADVIAANLHTIIDGSDLQEFRWNPNPES